jgi:hypothetical protein
MSLTSYMMYGSTTTPLTYNPNTGMLITTQFTTTGSYGSAQKFYKDTSDTYPLQLTTDATYYDKSIKLISKCFK